MTTGDDEIKICVWTGGWADIDWVDAGEGQALCPEFRDVDGAYAAVVRNVEDLLAWPQLAAGEPPDSAAIRAAAGSMPTHLRGPNSSLFYMSLRQYRSTTADGNGSSDLPSCSDLPRRVQSVPDTAGIAILWPMIEADVPQVVAIQEPASVVGLAAVFPQEEFPFPRDDVARRWREEISTPGTDCYVVVSAGAVVGFAALRGDEFLHFGVAIEYWGTGIAQQAHDALIGLMSGRGVAHAWLRVFTGNGRGRAFYERLGWRPTGERTCSTFAPNPELLHYERDLEDGSWTADE